MFICIFLAIFALISSSLTSYKMNKSNLINVLKDRILILDGAMGTMIQQHELEEADYRGEEFSQHGSELRGNNDLLSLTRPELISQIHEDYLAAGADIIETNTFNATRIAMADYNICLLYTSPSPRD